MLTEKLPGVFNDLTSRLYKGDGNYAQPLAMSIISALILNYSAWWWLFKGNNIIMYVIVGIVTSFMTWVLSFGSFHDDKNPVKGEFEIFLWTWFLVALPFVLVLDGLSWIREKVVALAHSVTFQRRRHEKAVLRLIQNGPDLSKIEPFILPDRTQKRISPETLEIACHEFIFDQLDRRPFIRDHSGEESVTTLNSEITEDGERAVVTIAYHYHRDSRRHAKVKTDSVHGRFFVLEFKVNKFLGTLETRCVRSGVNLESAVADALAVVSVDVLSDAELEREASRDYLAEYRAKATATQQSTSPQTPGNPPRVRKGRRGRVAELS